MSITWHPDYSFQLGFLRFFPSTSTCLCTWSKQLVLFFHREIHFDTVTHLLWTTQLGLVSTFMFMYEVKKSYFEPFPFIDIVNSCNFDPVRLIISRMKRYKAYTLRWWMSFSKWFMYPKANWFPSKYSVFQSLYQRGGRMVSIRFFDNTTLYSMSQRRLLFAMAIASENSTLEIWRHRIRNRILFFMQLVHIKLQIEPCFRWKVEKSQIHTIRSMNLNIWCLFCLGIKYWFDRILNN